MLDFLCNDCAHHFESVRLYLNQLGLDFVVNSYLMRGLDYYTRTTFEVQTKELGAQNAIAGGGRYDNLMKEFGGPDTPAIGFAIGVERVVELLEESAVQKEKGLIFFWLRWARRLRTRRLSGCRSSEKKDLNVRWNTNH